MPTPRTRHPAWVLRISNVFFCRINNWAIFKGADAKIFFHVFIPSNSTLNGCFSCSREIMASSTVKENSISSRVPGEIHAFNHLNIITQTTCDAKWLLEVSFGCTQEPFMFWNFFLGTSTAFCQLPLFSIVTEVMAFFGLNKGFKLNNAPPEGKMMKLYLHVSTWRSHPFSPVCLILFSSWHLHPFPSLCVSFCCCWQPLPPPRAPTALWAA